MTSLAHLARRFATSLSRREPAADDVAWALAQLLPGEAALWQRMVVQDRRHSLLVARRFVAACPSAERSAVAGALLHDIGKVDCRLGTFGRVAATIVGPRTTAFRAYHDHERLGADLLAAAGSDAVTIELVQGRGPLAAALRAADDI